MTRRYKYQEKDLDLGFGRHDTEIIDSYNSIPKVQLLISKEPPKEQQIKYCSSCNQKIEWLEQTRRFICYSCGVTYHELYDTPLASLDQAIRPLQSNNPYERIEPAILSAKVDRRLQGERINKNISHIGNNTPRAQGSRRWLTATCNRGSHTKGTRRGRILWLLASNKKKRNHTLILPSHQYHH